MAEVARDAARPELQEEGAYVIMFPQTEVEQRHRTCDTTRLGIARSCSKPRSWRKDRFRGEPLQQAHGRPAASITTKGVLSEEQGCCASSPATRWEKDNG